LRKRVDQKDLSDLGWPNCVPKSTFDRLPHARPQMLRWLRKTTFCVLKKDFVAVCGRFSAIALHQKFLQSEKANKR
jgi:hypothetical protein